MGWDFSNFTFRDPQVEAAARRKAEAEAMLRHAQGERALWGLVSRGSAAAAAAALLNLALPATAEQIKKAYRAALFKAHPDTAKADEASNATMAQLQAARDLLLKLDADEVNQSVKSKESKTCFVCRGAGRVMVGFVAEPCSTCGGTGAVEK
jgi:hypothetical protein